MKTFWEGCRVAVLLYLAVSTHALDDNAKTQSALRFRSESGRLPQGGVNALEEAQNVIKLGQQIASVASSDGSLGSEQKEVIAKLVSMMADIPENPDKVKDAIQVYKDFLARQIQHEDDSGETVPDDDGDVFYDAREDPEPSRCDVDIALIEELMDNEAGHLARKVESFTACAKSYEKEDGNGEQMKTETAEQPALITDELLQLSARSRSSAHANFFMSFLNGVKDFALGKPVDSGIPLCPINGWISNNIERAVYLWNRWILWQDQRRSHSTARIFADVSSYICPAERQFWNLLASARLVSPLEVVGLGRSDSLLGVYVFIGVCAILWMVTATSRFSPGILNLITKHEKKSIFFKKEFKKMSAVEKAKHCTFRACRTLKDICTKINNTVELERVTKVLGTAVVVRSSWYLMRWIIG